MGDTQAFPGLTLKPFLWKPGRDCYVEVESLPTLRTGKLDLKGIKEIALSALSGD